ncbi:MAG: hypothetical protein FWF96_03645, partial [Kiritimatiellaeota bacterium]|nr:hypothetical protein [Kiritimatiellota bacterium]
QTFTVSSGAWTEVAGNVFRRVVAAKKGAITYQMDFKIEGGVVSGSWTSSVRATPCAVFGGRNTWGKSRPASAYEGYYTALLPPGTATTHPAGAFGNTPRGYGFITFTVASAGTVRYSGRLADGTTLSGTSALLEDGALCWIPVYKALYARTGSFGALLAVQRGVSPAANTVSLAKAGWIYNGKRTALHADAFRMRGMDAADTGGWYDKRQNLAGHYLGKYGFTAANPGIPYVDASGTFALSAALVPDKLAIVANGAAGLVKLDANEARATLSASRATGLASGKFNLVYDLPGKPAKNVSVPWRGVLTPSAACGLGGAGYYLLPDKTLQKPFNAHKFSFPVEIQGL